MESKSAFQAIIFDLDGVLVDSEGINMGSARLSFEKFGFALTEDDLALIPGRHPMDYVPDIIKRNNLSLTAETIMQKQYVNYDNLWEREAVLMPSVEETLHTLKDSGKVMALATSASMEIVEKFIKRFGFSNIFSVIVTVDDVVKRKPDPEVYMTTKKKLGFEDKSIMVVEDTEVGIVAAKDAGLKCAAVPNKYTKGHNFSKADYILESIKELIELV